MLLDDPRRMWSAPWRRRRCQTGRLDGVPHGFVTGAGKYNAAEEALSAVGEFLAERLGSTAR